MVTTMREKEPGSISSTLDEVNEGREFQGNSLTGQTADLTGILPHEQFEGSTMSGHPATESEEPEQEPDSEEEGPSGSSQFSYTSQAEAERAAEESQRQIARLTGEINETQDLILGLLGQEDQELSGETAPAETASNYMKQRRAKVLDELEALDPDDEDFKDRVAEAQAQGDEDILKYYQQENERLETRKAEYRQEVTGIISQAETAMREAGLDPERDSTDSVLFWSLSQLIPSEKDGRRLSIEEQISQTIQRVKGYKGQGLKTHRSKEEGSSSPEEPTTLSDIVDQITRSRRA